MFYKDHAQCDLSFKSSCISKYINQNFQAKNSYYNNATVKWKFWNLRFYLSNIVYLLYWSIEQICWEIKVWMSSFLNIRSSHLEFTNCKKMFLKFLENSSKNIKNIRDAAFTLKFQAKCAFLRISQMF